MIVHLVRHGEVFNPDHLVYAAVPGFRLSPVGREQAVAAGTRLADRPISAVVTSPLERARQTADAIAFRHDIEPIVDDRLTEWKLADRWAMTRWESLPEAFPGELEAYLADPTNLPFSEESIEECGARVSRAVEDAALRHDPEIVFVSHQDPVQAARLIMTRRPLRDLMIGKPGHASVVTLERSSDGWRELDYWEPHQPHSFPSIDVAAGDSQL